MKDVDWWVTHSLDKIFPQTEMMTGASKEALLMGAGNEKEDFQIVIRPRGEMNLDRVSFSFSPLESDGGDRLDSAELEGHWIWYTWVINNPPHSTDPGSWLRNAPGYFPDAFLENKEYSVKPDWTQPLWISVNIPPDTAPGTYRGEVVINCTYTRGDTLWGGVVPPKETGEIRVPLSLTVWPFSLPRDGTLHHTEWFFPDALASWYNLEPWSEEHWAWIEKAACDMAGHYQDMILTDPLALVDISSGPEGDLCCDYTRLDRWINLFRKAGVEWIEMGHIAARIGGWESPFGFKRFLLSGTEGDENPCSRENMEEENFIPVMKAFMVDLYEHLEEEFGLGKLVQHIADEPLDANRESWMTIAGLVKSWIPPSVPTMDAAFSEELGDLIDIRVPQIQEIKAESRVGEKTREDRLWSYVCLAPQGHHPNRFLDQRSVKNRILFWLSFSLGLEGFLHWGYNFWGSWCSSPDCVRISPWTDATGGSVYAHKRQPLPAGDPFIVYPGREKICSSIRWEVLRKGFEDHKLLCLLKEEAEKDGGRTEPGKRGLEILDLIKREIAHDSLTYCRRGEMLIDLRHAIGNLISQLISSKDTPADSGAS